MKMADIIAFEPDLPFSSRIQSVSDRIGATNTITTVLDSLKKEFKACVPRALIVNLDALREKIIVFEELTKKRSYTILSYYSRVNRQLAEEGKRIGIDWVVPRAAFVARTEELTRKVLNGVES